jgi:hypothetical protein
MYNTESDMGIPTWLIETLCALFHFIGVLLYWKLRFLDKRMREIIRA